MQDRWKQWKQQPQIRNTTKIVSCEQIPFLFLPFRQPSLGADIRMQFRVAFVFEWIENCLRFLRQNHGSPSCAVFPSTSWTPQRRRRPVVQDGKWCQPDDSRSLQHEMKFLRIDTAPMCLPSLTGSGWCNSLCRCRCLLQGRQAIDHGERISLINKDENTANGFSRHEKHFFPLAPLSS